MYNFYEIECPNCKHQFVWLEHTYKGSIYKVYRRMGHDEVLESAKCPKCDIEMVVIKETHSTIDVKDDSVEVIGSMHGI